MEQSVTIHKRPQREPTVTMTHGELRLALEQAERLAALRSQESTSKSPVVAIVCGSVVGLFILLTFFMAMFNAFMKSMEAQAIRNHELAMKAVEQSVSANDVTTAMFIGAGIVIFVILFIIGILKKGFGQ